MRLCFPEFEVQSSLRGIEIRTTPSLTDEVSVLAVRVIPMLMDGFVVLEAL